MGLPWAHYITEPPRVRLFIAREGLKGSLPHEAPQRMRMNNPHNICPGNTATAVETGVLAKHGDAPAGFRDDLKAADDSVLAQGVGLKGVFGRAVEVPLDPGDCGEEVVHRGETVKRYQKIHFASWRTLSFISGRRLWP